MEALQRSAFRVFVFVLFFPTFIVVVVVVVVVVVFLLLLFFYFLNLLRGKAWGHLLEET